jgi:predicted secreted Zn-dependent protease
LTRNVRENSEEKMIVWTILEAQIQDHKKGHKNEKLKHGIKMQDS